ncbi:head-tail adaptor protein [uncultured Parasphingorhabdus sp.]|uniref:phage head completion protein n=1 Tax=uncultured Parasphingorhabdus sp. TaxID=2709694 RepID=UPI0030D96F88|tara:strand:+ start:21625 stop:21951 length:327 start_codon:yes stop_codon:yes gene_type:complete
MGQEFSGILRERIVVERQAAGRDALASADPQYSTIGEYWAAAEALDGGSASEAESRSSMPRWRFILRETRAIKPGDRLLWSGRTMTIASVILEHRLIPKTILQAEETR